jgi:hypothetical protein
VLAASTAGALQVRQNLKAWLDQHEKSNVDYNSHFPACLQSPLEELFLPISILNIGSLLRSNISYLAGNMSKAERDKLDYSLQQDGLKEEIILCPNLEILDGWHRHRACLRTNTKPKYLIFIGSKPKQMDYFLATQARRNQTAGQRACELALRVCLDLGLEPKKVLNKDYWDSHRVGDRLVAWRRQAQSRINQRNRHKVTCGNSSVIKGELVTLRKAHGLNKNDFSDLFYLIEHGGPAYLRKLREGLSIRKLAAELKGLNLPKVDTSDMFPADPVVEMLERWNRLTSAQRKRFLKALPKT